MRRTFEVYIFDETGERDFEPLLCDRLQLVQEARAILDTRANAAMVEVWEGADHLLTLAR